MFGLSALERYAMERGYQVRANCSYEEARIYMNTRYPRKKWWQFWRST